MRLGCRLHGAGAGCMVQVLVTWYEDCGHVEELVPGEVQLHLQAAEVPPPLVLLGGVHCSVVITLISVVHFCTSISTLYYSTVFSI